MMARSASLKAETDAMGALERVMSRLADMADYQAVRRVTRWFIESYQEPEPEPATSNGAGHPPTERTGE